MTADSDETSKHNGELEERFFDLSIDLLCFLDFSSYFKRLNPAWERTLGFTREELMSKPFIEFVHPDDRDRTLEQNREVRDGGHARLFENRYLCKDGSFKWLLWNAAPDSGRQVIYSVARDITERKQAEAERESLVQQLQAALTKSERCRGSFRSVRTARAFATIRTTGRRSRRTFRNTPTLNSRTASVPCYRNVVEPGFK
jgi:PAS domain S-box-containing protein